MKALEAKQIISNILEWQFILVGIKNQEDLILHDIDMRQYSLADFIEANRIVHVCNQKSKTMYDYLKKSGKKPNGFKAFMTVHDRLLAAVYTIINYDPQDQVVAAYDDKGTAIIKLKYS